MGKKLKGVRDLERTRILILDAAAKEFAEHGLSGARVDKIAARAGVNKAMLYYIFGKKADLHLAVLENLFEEKTRDLDYGILDTNITRDGLILMLNNYFDAISLRKEYARIMLYDIASGAKALRRLKKKRPELFAYFTRISEMLERLSGQGIIKKVDPDKSLMVLVMIMVFLASMLPSMDLVSTKGSEKHKSLSNPDKWKEFFAATLLKEFINWPEPE